MTPDDVPGRIPNATGATLRAFAREVPADQLIVEIGAFKGKSTCYLGVGASEGNGARVVSIDAWDTPGNHPGPNRVGPIYVEAGNQAQAARHVQECGVGHLVTQIKGFSTEVDIPEGPIGLLWVDGAHDYNGAAADFARFCPRVVAGGVLVVDDYRTGHCKDVDRAVSELVADTATWESWDLQPPLAIGKRR